MVHAEPAKSSKPAKSGHRQPLKDADSPIANEADDRLSADDQRLVNGLTERQMPELVDELLAQRPLMYQVHVARAYSHSAVESKDPVFREHCARRAAEYYRKVLELRNDAKWFRGDSRRFDVAQWHVELADLIVGHEAASDLDRFEITSGLDFDHARLSEHLREAHDEYLASKALLDDLIIGLRTEEERFMLLGLTDRIARLAEDRELNAAWTDVYSGMIAPRSEPGRAALVAGALTDFDNVARATTDPMRKYNALIGAGIALREAGRHEEALAALDRVNASTAGPAIIARARYEKVRGLLASGQFEAARKQSESLAAMGSKPKKEPESGAVFYIRLAPLLSAYGFALQSRVRGENSPESQRLMNSAVAAFDELSQRGGPWPEIVQVYLRSFEGSPKDPASLSDAALRGDSRRAMAEGKYEDALESLRILANRTTLKKDNAEDRFNLAVCYFRTRQIRQAADEFAALAEMNAAGDLSERAAEYAYRCYCQLAGETKDKKDCAQLARAADVLATRFPNHPLAAEAAWACGLAHEESGDLTSAIRAYGGIAPSSPNYWTARRSAARCHQSLYAGLPSTTSPSQRKRVSREACDAWQELANQLARASDDAVTSFSRQDWIVEARRFAATILLSDDLRDYKQALDLLAQMPPTVDSLRLKVAALRGLGDLDGARKAVDELFQHASDDEAGPVLLALAVDLEARAARLQQMGRAHEAQVAAAEAVPTFQQLMDWLQRRPDHKKEIVTAQISLGNLLKQAGRNDQAAAAFGACMEADPSNGECIRQAALLQEESARTASGPARTAAQEKAEGLWNRLLLDAQLRENAPAKYWEARYYWLSHQLRRGRAGEVLKGIETEQAWYPELGGPPWQGRLLELAEQARAATGSRTP